MSKSSSKGNQTNYFDKIRGLLSLNKKDSDKGSKSIIPQYNYSKKIMRLCAIGMVADGKVNDTEKECITYIMVRDILNRINGQNKKNKTQQDTTPIENEIKRLKALTPELGDIKYSINTDSDEYKAIENIYNNLKKNSNNKSLKNEQEGTKNETGDNTIPKENSNNKSQIPNDLQELFNRARYYVENVVKRLGKSVNAQQGLFVDIGSYDDEVVKRELLDIILVILADNSILESERVAFLAIARVFRVRRVAKLWDQLTKVDNIEELFNGKFIFYIERKKIIDADDVRMIEEAICNYKIQGALKEGLKNATIAEKERYVKTMDRLNHNIFMAALSGFILSALTIYISISFLIEDKTIIRECLDNKSPIENIYYRCFIDDPDTDICNMTSNLSFNIEHNPNPDVIRALAGQEKDSAKIDSVKKDTVAVEKAKKDITKWGIKDTSHIGDNKFFLISILVLIMYAGYQLSPCIYKTYKGLKKRLEKVLHYWLVRLFVVPLCKIILITAVIWGLYILISVEYLSMLYYPIMILILMISIELMIFLRGRNVEKLGAKMKKDSTVLLVVIVVMAIVADMCISFIELPVEWEPGMLADKFAAALLLGCLCFFVGKFLDMYAMQKQIDISNMQASIERIETELESAPKQ